jgi:S1-C subfamily serine protease
MKQMIHTKIFTLTTLLTILSASCMAMDTNNPCVTQTQSNTTQIDGSWAEVYQRISNAVVRVEVFGREFNWDEPHKPGEQKAGSGSAFLFKLNKPQSTTNKDDKIYICTNYHVIEQAEGLSIQFPKIGHESFKVKFEGGAPDYDCALLYLEPKELSRLKAKLKEAGITELPYLTLGSSDELQQGAEVMLIGHPLGDQTAKGTTGVIAGQKADGCRGEILNVTAASNPGNSGGPCVNKKGEVVGILTGGRSINSGQRAEGLNRVLPISYLEPVLTECKDKKIINAPYWGIIEEPGSVDLFAYYGIPEKEQGVYVQTVLPGSLAEKAGIKPGDIISKLNDISIDRFGLMFAPWSTEKIAFTSYLARCKTGDAVTAMVWRKGGIQTACTMQVTKGLPSCLSGVKTLYLPFQPKPAYTVFGGLVITELTLNYLNELPIELMQKLASRGINQEYFSLFDVRNYAKSYLVVSHQYPDINLSRDDNYLTCNVIEQVNGTEVHTVQEFEEAVLAGADSGFVTIKTNLDRFVVLSLDSVLEQEPELASRYNYPLSKAVKTLMEKRQ